MKFQAVLNLLEDDPSDATVRMAIDWLKKKKPSIKGAQKVLQQLILRPQFEAELDWLSDWIRDDTWESLRWISCSIRSLAVYDWLIQFLDANSQRADCAMIWNGLVMWFRDESVVSKAALWLDKADCVSSDASFLAANLLEYGPTEAVKSKAKACLEHNNDDFLLVANLIEFTNDRESINLGLELLLTAGDPVPTDYIASALLQVNSGEYSPAVAAFVHKHWNNRFIRSAIDRLLRKASSIPVSLVMQWIEEHPKASHVHHLFWSLLQTEPTQEKVGYAWSWYKKNGKHPEAISILCSILNTGIQSEVLDDAINHAREWQRSNRDEHWFQIAAALLQATPAKEKDTLGAAFIEELSSADRGYILQMLLEQTPSNASLALARMWLAKHPDFGYATDLKLKLVKWDPDVETIAQAKECIPTGDVAIDWQILASLVRAGDDESISQAKSAVGRRHLNPRFSGQHFAKRTLLLALLEAGVHEPIVFEQTEEWLQTKPSRGEGPYYAELRAAYNASRKGG